MSEINWSNTVRRRPFCGFSVALVGADGSGKSTMANEVLQTIPQASKYIYMGASTEASNITLPTSRLLVMIKRRRIARHINDSEPLPPADVMSAEMKEKLPSGKIVKALGLVNRIAEEWYRQLFVWFYMMRGYIVICDRHFLYEYFPDSETLRSKDNSLSVRLHGGMLSRLFPRPTLTLFLDAPPEVLYSRKPEWTTEHLKRQRLGIMEQGRASKNFVVIDATQPIDAVFSDVLGHIEAVRNNGAG